MDDTSKRVGVQDASVGYVGWDVTNESFRELGVTQADDDD